MNLPIDPGPLPAHPLVSVLTANYNYARFLREAVASVKAQTYPHWEMVICDDGSTDNSRHELQQLETEEPRLRTVLLKRNSGMGVALNAAYVACRGELICLLDADDYCEPERLATLVEAARRMPSAGLLIHPVLQVRSNWRPFGIEPPVVAAPGWYGPAMASGGGWPSSGLPPCSGLCLRRSVADVALPAAVEFRSSADTAIAFAAAAAARLSPASLKPLVQMRYHGGNLTSRRRPDIRGRAEAYQKIVAFYDAARRVSGLAGPWPLPTSLGLSHATILRLQKKINGGEYRRMARANSLWRDLPWWKRRFFDLAALIPQPLLAPSYNFGSLVVHALRSSRAGLSCRWPKTQAQLGTANEGASDPPQATSGAPHARS